MTGELPLAARTVKGRTRAAMTRELLAAAETGRVRIAIGRASDFFGAGITTGTPLAVAIGVTVAWYQSQNATPHRLRESARS